MILPDQPLRSFRMTASPVFHRSNLNPSSTEKEISQKRVKSPRYRGGNAARHRTRGRVTAHAVLEVNAESSF